jgi:hypothetical protein
MIYRDERFDIRDDARNVVVDVAEIVCLLCDVLDYLLTGCGPMSCSVGHSAGVATHLHHP